MALEQLIAIIIFALIALFAWAIFKKVFKLLFYVGIIIFLLLAANLFFIYNDMMDLKENFGISTKKVLLVDEKEVIAGLLLGNEVNMIDNDQFDAISEDLKNEDYDEILGDSYKLMVFDIGIISEIENEIQFGEELITSDEAITKLKSDDMENEMKASLFSIILADEILGSNNPLFFFSEYKKGNIIIYPETALFKTINVIPLAFFKDVAKKMFQTTKDKVTTYVVRKI